MRRSLWAVAVGLTLALLLAVPAQGSELAEAQLDALDTDQLEELTEGYLDGVELDISIDLEQGLSSLWEQTVSAAGTILTSTIRTGVLLLITVLLCGLLDVTHAEFGGKGVDLTAFAGTAGILALSMADVHSLAAIGKSLMEQLEELTTVLLPLVSATLAASGSITGAGVRQVATIFFSDILLTLMNRLLLPMVYLYMAACAGYTAVGNPGLKQIAALLKWAVTGILTGLTTVYVAYLTAASALAGTADTLTARAAGLAISGMVPVVGGILSSATETVMAGAGLLKNAIGIFGILAVLAFCLVPFLRLALHYLIYKVTAVLAATLSGGRIAELIGSVGTAFGLILGIVGAGSLILLVSLISAIGVSVG